VGKVFALKRRTTLAGNPRTGGKGKNPSITEKNRWGKGKGSIGERVGKKGGAVQGPAWDKIKNLMVVSGGPKKRDGGRGGGGVSRKKASEGRMSKISRFTNGISNKKGNRKKKKNQNY